MVNLTQEQLAALHNAGDQIALIQAEINRAAEAGLDTKELQAQLNEVEKVRSGLLRVYGGVTQRRRVV